MPQPIVKLLAREDKTTAFPIQVDTLPDTLAGRDVLGRGKTGSGKTLAFSIPMVARLGAGSNAGGCSRKPRGLVLAPTRELATQINAVLEPLARAYGMNTTTIFGGVPQRRQEIALDRGADIVVACPGRLEDLMRQRVIDLSQVEVTVIDEADHMADLGFLPGVTRILQATPQGGQRLLFSATLDNGVDKIVRQFLKNEVRHSVDNTDSHVEAMTHHVYEIPNPEAKKEVLRSLASGTGRRILFTRTKHQAKKLAAHLTESGIPAVDLHGNLNQRQRDRNLAAFGGEGVRVLVATDVAARGVHVDGVELVVHVDPPAEHKAYLHRSGRTARAGSAGDVVTLVLPSQRRDTRQLLRRASIDAQPQQVTMHHPALTRLVGEVAAHVDPAVSAARDAKRNGGRPSQGSGGRSKGSGGRPQRDGRSRGGSSRHGSGRSGGAGSSRSAGEGSTRSGGSSQRRSGGQSAGRSGGYSGGARRSQSSRRNAG